MSFHYYVGIDCSADKFDFHLLDPSEATVACGQVANQDEAIEEWLKDFAQRHDIEPAQDILFCVENTGVYSIRLAYRLHQSKQAIWLQDALQIKQSIGRINAKTDALDAYYIGRYAVRNYSDYELFTPNTKIEINLNYLVSQRKLLLKVSNQLGNQMGELKKHTPAALQPDAECYQPSEVVLTQVKAQLKVLERKMHALIRSDERYKRSYEVLTSLPGIGKVVATRLLAKTRNLATGFDAKKLASLIGVAPLPRQSGKRLKRKPKTSKRVDQSIKSAFHMGMLRHIHNDNRIGYYYRRKLAQGKEHNSIINAISCIMLKTACACLRKDEPYVADFFAKNLQTS